MNTAAPLWSLRRAGRILPGALLLALLFPGAPHAEPAAASAPDASAPDALLAFAESLYQQGEYFRAESELLRFLHDYPGHPGRAAAELGRAKLYYRDGRFSEAALMLHSWLDRYPRDERSGSAARLLLLSQVRSGDVDGANRTQQLIPEIAAEPSVGAALGEPHPHAPDPAAAVAWSTVLPGSGYFLLDQPAKAATAFSLNLAVLAGAVIAYRQDNYGAALVLALVEIALYGGQREAVRHEAEAELARLDAERRASWAGGHGQRDLLRVGIEFEFGGD